MADKPAIMSNGAAVIRGANALAVSRGVSLTTVSKWLFRDWRRIAAIASGKSFLRPPTERLALRRLKAIEGGKPLPSTPKRKGASDGQANEPAGECRSEGSVTSENRESRSRG